MNYRHRWIQAGLFLLAGGLLAASIAARHDADQARRDAGLQTEQTEASLKQNPYLQSVTMAPGGLRTMAVNYLWIRAQQAHQEGRHYDAYQLADAICQLQPYFPGVWVFQSWNMAWNISVTKHTREERWNWIYNGVELLRDRGITMNPHSLQIYAQISWIFFSKMGGQIDDMHWTYKQRWAGEMQRLLGAPPLDDGKDRTLSERTQMMIDAFRPIAEAPLDKTPIRQGAKGEWIQRDQLEILLADPDVLAYADALAANGVLIDRSLLDAYNRWSMEEAVTAYRVTAPNPQTEPQEALFSLLNDPREQSKRPRELLLAFVRAQLLWNQYRMDPDYMLMLMEKGVEHNGTTYAIPLDWRHVMAHSLYWAHLGRDRAGKKDPNSIDWKNNNRNLLNSLKSLTFYGMIALQERPTDPDYPLYLEMADLRYIEPTHQQHLALAEEDLQHYPEEKRESMFEIHTYDTGHVNFMMDSIMMLVADGREDEAQKYYEWLREKYMRHGENWKIPLVKDFVIANMQEDIRLRYNVALAGIQFSLKRAILVRAIQKNPDRFKELFQYAEKMYRIYQANAVERLKLRQSFPMMAGQVLSRLIAQPGVFALNLSTAERIELYQSFSDVPKMQVVAYHYAEPVMRRLAQKAGLEFSQAFPKPVGLDEFRRAIQEKMRKDQTPDRRIQTNY